MAVQGANVVITNNAAAASDTGNAAPVTLTPTQVATPTVVPTLPASVLAADIPTQAELDVLGAKYQACLTLPINQRVTQDAQGTVTAVQGNGTLWAISGPGAFFVEARLVRYQGLNPDPATDAYFNTDRVESVLRLTADPSVGDTDDIRAVRVTGPGLPPAGVVMQRSQRCATQLVLAAARLDGMALAPPTPSITATSTAFQDFAPTALANPSATVPSFSRYKFEFFYFSSASDTPDFYRYVRLGAGAENPGAVVAWPMLDAAFMSARLSPTGAKTGAQTSFVDTMAWTQPASLYVNSGYWFGPNFSNTTNAAGEVANYAARGRVDYLLAAFGDLSAPGYQLASPRAGTSLSTNTATHGSNPNPRCAVAGLPALTTSTADYREAGVSLRTEDRQLRQAIWYWRN